MNKKTSKFLKIVVGIVVILVIVISIIISIKLAKTFKDPSVFKEYIESFGIYSPIIYTLMNISQILIPLIPGEPMELVAGYAFGSVKGTILCFVAESIGSIIVLLLVRKFGRKLVEFYFDKDKIDSLNFLQNEKRNILLTTILFLMPGTPKDLLCYVVGLTKIDLKMLMVITTLCRLPSIVTSTLIGGGLGEKSYGFTIVVFIITSLLSISGIYTFKNLKK